MKPQLDPMPDNQQPQQNASLRIRCEVYSRIVGYLRPVQNWNRGKQQEYQERRPLRLPKEEDAPRHP